MALKYAYYESRVAGRSCGHRHLSARDAEDCASRRVREALAGLPPTHAGRAAYSQDMPWLYVEEYDGRTGARRGGRGPIHRHL
jgi:hypothetical protein